VPVNPKGIPPKITFPGKTKAGTYKAPKHFMFVNPSKTFPITFSRAFISPSSPLDFQFGSAQTCVNPVGVLGPKQKCLFSLFFTPTSPGAKNATLTIIDNAGTGQQVVPLQGTAK
jgi:hypothetical protein